MRLIKRTEEYVVDSEEDAIKAKEALNGFEFGGRKLKVDFATPKAPKEQQ